MTKESRKASVLVSGGGGGETEVSSFHFLFLFSIMIGLQADVSVSVEYVAPDCSSFFHPPQVCFQVSVFRHRPSERAQFLGRFQPHAADGVLQPRLRHRAQPLQVRLCRHNGEGGHDGVSGPMKRSHLSSAPACFSPSFVFGFFFFLLFLMAGIFCWFMSVLCEGFGVEHVWRGTCEGMGGVDVPSFLPLPCLAVDCDGKESAAASLLSVGHKDSSFTHSYTHTHIR